MTQYRRKNWPDVRLWLFYFHSDRLLCRYSLQTIADSGLKFNSESISYSHWWEERRTQCLPR